MTDRKAGALIKTHERKINNFSQCSRKVFPQSGTLKLLGKLDFAIVRRMKMKWPGGLFC